ncbi:MAG: HEAT repeat protein [Verrucomicrobiales bacterium]|jgi:HEAT repeat protein
MKITCPLWPATRSISAAILLSALLLSGFVNAADVTQYVEDLQSEDARKRREAAFQLYELGPEAVDALPSLIEALDDDQEQVFFYVVSALAKIGPEAELAIPALIDLLKPVRKRYGEQINLRAVFALSRIGQAAVPQLRSALKDSDETVCANALDALALMDPAVSSAAADEMIGLLGDDRERVADRNVKALAKSGGRVLPEIEAVLRDGNASQQRDAIRALGLIGQSASNAAPTIVTLAQSQPSAFLGIAVDALVRMRHDSAVTSKLTVAGLKSSDEKVANAAADASLLLQQVQPNLDTAPFAEALRDTPEDIQLRFAKVLGRMGTSAAPAVDALIAAAEKATTTENALAFAEALSGIGEPAAAPLINAAGRFPVAELTEDSWPVAALGYIGKPALSALRQGLKAESISARKASVAALGLLGTHAAPATDDLFASLNDPASEVRGHALIALPLAGVSSERMLPLLEPLVSDSSDTVRAQAFRAMGKIKDSRDRTLPLLIKGITDPAQLVQASAIEATGNLGEQAEAAVPSLKKVLDSNIPEQEATSSERAAIEALGKIGPAAQPAVSSLLTMVKNSETEVRVLTLNSLRAIGNNARNALPEVRAALSDDMPEVRAQAVDTVAEIESDPKKLTNTLLTALDDPESAVRDTAVKRLAGLGEDARPAAPKLFEILATAKDPQPIIEALQTIRSRDPQLYVSLLTSESSSVRLFACESLGRLGSRAVSALPELEKLKDDEYDFVRRRAFQAMERINRRR